MVGDCIRVILFSEPLCVRDRFEIFPHRGTCIIGEVCARAEVTDPPTLKEWCHCSTGISNVLFTINVRQKTSIRGSFVY